MCTIKALSGFLLIQLICHYSRKYLLQFHPTNKEIGTCTYVSLCVVIAPNFSVLDGQAHQKFFRKDYTFLEDAQGFYKIHTIHKTWQDAKKQCQMEGASLFYAEDEIEADAVQSLWNRTQPQFAWVYVGISDLLAKGVFETIDGQYIITISLLWELPHSKPIMYRSSSMESPSL